MRFSLIATLLAAALVAGCGPAPEAGRKAEARMEAPRQIVREVAAEPYPEAASVRLFVETGHTADGKPIFQSANGRRLTGAERAEIEAPIRKSLFDKAGRKVGEIAICFCCGCISAEPGLPTDKDAELTIDWASLKAVLDRMGVPTNIACDA